MFPTTTEGDAIDRYAALRARTAEPLPVLRFDATNVSVLAVTPATASALLELNRYHRRVHEPAVRRLMTDIDAGLFHFAPVAIVVSRSGNLLDGLQRLTAIVRTSKAQKMVVVIGASETSYEDMAVRPRPTLTAILKGRGEPGASALAAALTGIQAWEAGDRGRGTRPVTTINVSLDLLKRYPGIREIAQDAATFARRYSPLTSKDVSRLMWVFDRTGGIEARRAFFSALKSGANLPAGHPILALRTAYNEELARRKSHRTQMIAITCLAWNAFREGRDLDTLKNRAGGAKPDPFPEPV